MLRRGAGIVRSLVIYHARPWRHRAATAFYRQFLGPGDLGVDVGAHVGSRVRAWRALGARVVAVEPQPDCLRVLRLLYGRDGGVVIEPYAAGASPGPARLRVSTTSPTVSTLSAEWIDTVRRDHSFDRVRWDRSVEVDVTTLDALVARHGVPAFVKVDVEGFEAQVLAGLSRPVAALSFEVLPQAFDAGLTALAEVERLGRDAGGGGYEYNYSPVETMQWAAGRWVDAEGITELLRRYRPGNRSGDVYARLRQPDRPRGGVSRPRAGSGGWWRRREPAPGR